LAFKTGYSLENAAIAAAEVHGVDREVIRQHLTRVLHCSQNEVQS